MRFIREPETQTPRLPGHSLRSKLSLHPSLQSFKVVADLLSRIDIDPDRHENASLARFIAADFGFLTLIQSDVRPPR